MVAATRRAVVAHARTLLIKKQAKNPVAVRVTANLLVRELAAPPSVSHTHLSIVYSSKIF